VSSVSIVLVPAARWADPGPDGNPFGSLASLERDLRTNARRAAKGYETRDARGRMDRAAAAAEMTVAGADGADDAEQARRLLTDGRMARVPPFAAGAAIAAARSGTAREALGGLIGPGEPVDRALGAWRRLHDVTGVAELVGWLDLAAASRAGAVISVDAFAEVGVDAHELPIAGGASTQRWEPRTRWTLPSADPPPVLAQLRRAREFRSLWARLQSSAAAGLPARLGKVSDPVLAEALWALAHLEGAAAHDEARMPLRVEFPDGSVTDLLRPGSRIQPASHEDPEWPTSDLDVALMSARHPELDGVCTGSWLRNVDVSDDKPGAVASEAAFSLAQARLCSRVDAAIPLLMRLHQTGYAPAVIGTYRALCDARDVALVVVPMYFVDVDTPPLPGRVWNLA
jgi:hypothetical protein